MASSAIKTSAAPTTTEYNMDWNSICRVCLQDGNMHSIHDEDEENQKLSNKIMMCSSIVIDEESNLPEQICDNCLQDLSVAYRFRTNCESSEAILNSFVVTTITNANTTTVSLESMVDPIIPAETREVFVRKLDDGKVYQFQPPTGLNVKRVKVPAENPVKPAAEQIANIKSEVMDREDENEGVAAEIDINEEAIIAASQSIEENAAIDDALHEYHFVDRNGVVIDSKDAALFTTDYIDGVTVEDDPTSSQEIQSEKMPKVLKAISRTITGKPSKAKERQLKVMQILKTSGSQMEYIDFTGNHLVKVKRLFNDAKSPKICEICGNCYKYQHALESHMRRHRNERPYECEICGKGFVINFELSRHMRTHTGLKPYACKYCERKFSDFGSRVKHERTHTGERPYKCETCGKTFAYSHVLTSHNLIHTGEKKYHCDKCGKRFAKSHHLKAHLNTHEKHANVKYAVKLGKKDSILSRNVQNILLSKSNSRKTIIDQDLNITADTSDDHMQFESNFEILGDAEQNMDNVIVTTTTNDEDDEIDINNIRIIEHDGSCLEEEEEEDDEDKNSLIINDHDMAMAAAAAAANNGELEICGDETDCYDIIEHEDDDVNILESKNAIRVYFEENDSNLE